MLHLFMNHCVVTRVENMQYTQTSIFFKHCGSHFYANMFYLRDSRGVCWASKGALYSLVGIRGCPIPSLSSGFDQPGLMD